ncbi:ABC transporter ATP-binding protein [Planctomycetota bacterium]|nr:ABC transporter ATP-binding protein [Planctomycetota bacterium]
MAMLAAENLWRSYDGKPAVKGLDFEVAKGSAYGFIGPNGAGKSTTLRILATVDLPDAGRVWIDGKDAIRHKDQVRRRLGFMPDPFHLYDTMRVEDFLAFFADAYRVPRSQRRSRIARAIELTRIKDWRRAKCGSLSKGWKQRVLLAKTLVHDPAVLLLDEPASGLDPAARIEFREIIRALRDLDKTVVVSSHILTELADFCDSVGIIEKGRMLVSGRIEDILKKLDPHDQLELELLGDKTKALGLLREHSAVQQVKDATEDSDEEPAELPAELPEAQPESSPPDDPNAQTVRTPVAAPGVHRVIAVLSEPSTPELRAAITRMLLNGDVGVAGLATRQENLEDLFLKVAGKIDGAVAPLGADALKAMLGPRRRRRPS